MTYRSRGRLTAVLVALSLGLAGAVIPATAAHSAPTKVSAPPLEEARRKARALRKAVDALELRAAQLIEDYNAANDELGRAVSDRLEAQAQLDRARASADAGSDAFAQRVRSLYMTGGTMTLYASVMSAPDLHEAFGRLANVNSVLRHEGITVDAADDTVALAEVAAGRLRDIALRQTQLERSVADASRRVEQTLAEQKALLAQADTTVKRLAEEERKRAEEAARIAFARQVAAAKARARAAAEAAAAAARAAGTTNNGSGSGTGGAAPTYTPGMTGQVTTGAAISALAGDPTTPPNAIVAKAIAAAKSQLGKPYLWGAVGPDSYDCSGLTGWAYRQAGVNLPRTSRQQWFAGTHPDMSELQPGDLLFWGPNRSNPQSIHHVALYIGAGMMIAAPRTGTFVRIQPVYYGDFFGVTRPT